MPTTPATATTTAVCLLRRARAAALRDCVSKGLGDLPGGARRDERIPDSVVSRADRSRRRRVGGTQASTRMWSTRRWCTPWRVGWSNPASPSARASSRNLRERVWSRDRRSPPGSASRGRRCTSTSTPSVSGGCRSIRPQARATSSGDSRGTCSFPKRCCLSLLASSHSPTGPPRRRPCPRAPLHVRRRDGVDQPVPARGRSGLPFGRRRGDRLPNRRTRAPGASLGQRAGPGPDVLGVVAAAGRPRGRPTRRCWRPARRSPM